MDHAGPPGGPNGSLTAKERRDWVGVIVPEPTPPSSDRWPSRPTHKRPIAKILTAPPSLGPPTAIARYALGARWRFSAPRFLEPERRTVKSAQQRSD